jgi:phosphoglucosamine mutase
MKDKYEKIDSCMVSSSKKLFGTDGIRGIANIHPMTPEIALRIGKAIGFGLKNKKTKKIVIGKDTRLSGYMIENALSAGIVSMGVDVYLVGPMPTPAIALLTKSLSANVGIVITASHNPAQDNGIKIFDNKGFKISDEYENEIENLVLSEKIDREEIKDIIGNKIGKAYRLDEARGRYIEFAKSTVKDFDLSGLKIVLDCANGAAYYVAPRVFSELGAELIVINDKPDGLNINKECGAAHPAFAAEIVKTQGANIGIILDGDADRLIICDENGEIVDGDYILAFCALELLNKGDLKNNALVLTEYSNLAVDHAVKKAGGKVIRTKNGDRYVIEEMKKRNYILGGETSGHIIFMNYVTTGDGIVSALQLLKMLKEKNKKPSSLKNIIDKNPQILLNIEIREKKPFEKMKDVNKKIKEINTNLKDEGRLLLRYSGTENICRIMIEGKDLNKIEIMANELAGSIKKEVGK